MFNDDFQKECLLISHLPYLERLTALRLEPLELRRLYFDLIQYYKILNNLTSLQPDLYFKFHYPPMSSRNPAPRLEKPSKSNNLLHSSFFYRHLDCWNSLPTSIKQSTSLLQFKRAIKSVNLTTFLKGSAFHLE